MDVINRTIIIVAFIIFLSSTILAQEDPIKYNLIEIPPSPNSSSLGKLADISTNLSTGAHSVQIPLISIDGGGVNLNITLNYSGGGVKVNEEASWVGLGWSLSTGGIITRNVRGLPDDQPLGYLNNCSKVPLKENVTLELLHPDSRYNTYQFLARVSNNLQDYEADIFYFSLIDDNGLFIFNNVSQPVCIPYKSLVIEQVYDGSLISGIYVTDSKGLVYFFGDTTVNSLYVEKTIVNNQGYDIEPYISSWLLQEIYNPFTNQKIKFNYKQHHVLTYNNTTVFSKYYTNRNRPAYFDLVYEDNTLRNINMYARYIENIDINGEKIFFHSEIGPDEKVFLDSILFKDRSIKFNHRYFTVNGDSTNETETRLKLVSLTQRSLSDGKVFKHRFSYYENPKLPAKTSYGVDSAGFYNGKSNNISAIPKLPLDYDFNYINNYILQVYHIIDTIGDADRSPDFQYAQSSSLKQIIYPTGGSTNFLYEGNTVARYPKVSEIGSFSDIRTQVYDSLGSGYYYDSAILILDELKRYTQFKLKTLIEFADTIEQPHWGAYVCLKNIALNKVIFSENYTALNFDPDAIVTFHDSLFESSSEYKLIIRLNRARTATLFSKLSYKEYNPLDLTILRDFPACGIRVKSIIDSVDNRVQVKSYDYSLSGYITNPFKKNAIYGYVKEYEHGEDEIGDILHMYNTILVYDDPIGGLGTNNNIISYSKVTEVNGFNNKTEGKTIYWFKKIYDQDFSNIDLAPHISQQYLRDLVVKQALFNKDGKLVKKLEYQYDNDSNQNEEINCFRATHVGKLLGVQISLQDYASEYNYGNYFYKSINYKLSKVRTSEIINNDSLVIEKTFFYDPFYIDNLKKTVETTSNGGTIITNFKYPRDFIPESNICKTQYLNEMQLCYNEYTPCETELQGCLELYNSIYSDFKQCRNLQLLKTRTRNLGYQPAESGLKGCYDKHNNDYNNFYVPCLEASYCNYLKCKTQADMNYQQCQLEYQEYLINSFNSTTDPNLKSIFLFALFNCNSLLIEKSVSYDGILISNEEKKFRIFYDDHDTIPILDRLLNKKAVNELQEIIDIDSTDKFSNILQNTVDSIVSSYQYGYNNSKYLIAQTKNSTIEECAHSGFENNEVNSWITDPHYEFKYSNSYTGKASLVLEGSNTISREFTVGENARKHDGYEASLWVNGSLRSYIKIYVKGHSSVFSISDNEMGSEDKWTLLKVKLNIESYQSYINSSFTLIVEAGCEDGSTLIDDIRFHPSDAQMTTYTYDPLIGVTSISDINNKAEIYEYDGFGRVLNIRDAYGYIRKKFDYNYQK